MILEDLKQLKTGGRELRKFGLLVGAVLAGLGVLFWVRGKAHFPFFLAPGVALVLLGTAAPRTLKHLYIGWMAMAILLGFVVSTLLLTLFFFVVITPVGLAARLMGKDFLRLKLDRQATTYWLARPRSGAKPPAEYERQY